MCILNEMNRLFSVCTLPTVKWENSSSRMQMWIRWCDRKCEQCDKQFDILPLTVNQYTHTPPQTPYSVWFSLCHAHSSVHSSAVEKSSGRERAVSVENGMCMFSCRPLSVMLLHYSLLVRVVIISSFLVQWVGTKWIKRKAMWKKTKEKWNTLHIKKIKTTHSRFSCKANKHQVHLERSIVFYCLKIKRWKKGFDNQAQTISFESVFV